MPPTIGTSDKSIVRAGRWRARLSRPAVVRAVAAVSLLVGAHFLWALAGWVNARLGWPVPFDLVPGAAVLVVVGSSVALVRRRPGVALSGSLVTFTLAMGWSALRAYGWPPLRHALETLNQTTGFAVAAILGTIAVLVGVLVVVLRWKPTESQEGSSRATPPAI